MHVFVGDPTERVGEGARAVEQAERLRAALGYDRPWHERLAGSARGYLRGDLGDSHLYARPVRDVLAPALLPTALLAGAAIALAYALGISGALAMLLLPPRLARWLDRATIVAAALPRFWLGVMLVLVFHDWLHWFPASHAAAPGVPGIALSHLALPALALALPSAAIIARVHRAAFAEALASPAAGFARACGLSAGRVLVREGVRPSLGTTFVLLALDLPAIVSGAVLVEVVFAWPGLGSITAAAVLGGDAPLALAATGLAAIAVVTANVLADAAATALDPRVRERAGLVRA